MNGSPLPTYIDTAKTSAGVISTTGIPTTGTYIFTGTSTSQFHGALTSTFSVTVILYNPANTTTQQAYLDLLQPTTLTLTGALASIDKYQIMPTDTTYRDSNVQFTFSQANNNLTLQALATLSGQEAFNLILTDGSNVELIVQQTTGIDNITIISQTYSGSIFKVASGNTVFNYTIVGSPTIYQPGISYALPNAGQALINTDGTYTITSPTNLTFNVSYAGSSSGSVTINVQATAPDPVNVEQPSYTQNIQTGATNVVINGYNLTPNVPYTALTYARFTWVGATLLVEQISSNFQNTSVRVESGQGTGTISVNEYTLILAQGVGQIQTLIAPTGVSVAYSVPFTPIAVSYDGAVIKGSQASSDIINGETKLGSFSFDGQILTINAGALSGYSKVLGFTNSSKATSYYRIQFTSSVTETNILPGAIVNYTTATIAVVGDAVSQVFPVIGGSVVLNSRVNVLSNTSIQVLSNYTPTGPYNFYVTFSDGTIINYLVDFQIMDISVPNITNFTVLCILTTGQIPTFVEAGVTYSNGYILNPNSLGQITMNYPFTAKITIHQL